MNETRKKSEPAFDLSPDEIRYVFSRSGGPGGQHVNKVSSRVTLIFDLPGSSRLTEEEKAILGRKLKRYLDKNGCIQIHSQKYRSQIANRNEAIARLQALLKKALNPPKKRKKTKIPRSAIEKRLRSKKHRSEIKRTRSVPEHPD